MAVIFNVKRRAGHPWRDDPEWDLLFARGDRDQEMQKFLEKARKSGWHLLMDGIDDDPRMDSHQCAMVLYKPHNGGGGGREWEDPYEWPYTTLMAADLTGAPEQQQADGDQGSGNPAD